MQKEIIKVGALSLPSLFALESLHAFLQFLTRDLILSMNTESATLGVEEDFTT